MIKTLPSWAKLFGSIELCDCEDCKSVLGKAAYFCDLLHFLGNCPANQNNETPLKVLLTQRPDLARIKLTCENTNTQVPYIDLVNEILEFFVARGNLAAEAARNVDEGATVEELAANPQNVDASAYYVLAMAKYPPNFPYVQPLHAMRSYLQQLGSSRIEVLTLFQPEAAVGGAQPDAATLQRVADAEWLKLSETEWEILTGKMLDGSAVAINADELHGFAGVVGWIGEMQKAGVGVSEYLRRSALSFMELLALLKTRFINPGIPRGHGGLSLEAIPFDYTVLKALHLRASQAGFQDFDVTTTDALKNSGIEPADFITWLKGDYALLGGVIVLQSPDLTTELEKTTLQHLDGAPIVDDDLVRIHRFVRLWRRLGWTVDEIDQALVLFAPSVGSIDEACLQHLATLKRLQSTFNGIAPASLLALFGNLDVDGATYRTLFRNRAVRELDPIFEPDRILASIAKTDDHVPPLLAALRISAAELQTIRDDCASSSSPIATGTLSLAVVSTIYHYAALARLLGVSLSELADLRVFCAIASLGQPMPAGIAALADAVEQIRGSGWNVAKLNYIARHIASPGTGPLEHAGNVAFALKLRDDLRRIQKDNELRRDPDGTFSRERLELLFGHDVAERVVRMILGLDRYTTKTLLVAAPPWEAAGTGIADPDLAPRLSYDPGSKALQLVGVLTAGQQAALDALNTAADPVLTKAIQELYDAPRFAARRLITDVLQGFLTDAVDAEKALLDDPNVADRFAYLLAHLLPYARDRLARAAVRDGVSTLLKLPAEATAALLDDIAKSPGDNTKAIIGDFFGLGESDFSQETFVDGPTAMLRRSGWIVPAVSDDFTFAAPAGTAVTLKISDLGSAAARVITPDGGVGAVAKLMAGTPYLFELIFPQAVSPSDRILEWRSASTPRQAVPQDRLLPAAALARAETALLYLAKMALVVAGFSLDAREAVHLSQLPDVKPLFDVASLPAVAVDTYAVKLFAAWQALVSYAAVRAKLGDNRSRLIDCLSESDMTAAVTALAKRGVWDATQAAALMGGLPALSKHKPTIGGLARVVECMAVVNRLGASPGDLLAWAKAPAHRLGLTAWIKQVWDIAQAVKRVAKAKYDDNDWLVVSKAINDELRDAQRAALLTGAIARALADPAPPFRNATEAFNYFLLDVENTSAVPGSRIGLAIESVHHFVSQCLFNQRTDVKPSAIDKKQWAVMSRSDIWHANRLVFLRPQYWLRPELCKEMSPIFRESISELMQRQVTKASAEDVIRNYVAKFEQVARPEICGLYLEDFDPDTGAEINRLHVFGRTGFGSPRSYFYRRRDEAGVWSAWEPVQLDIVGVDEYPGGVHLTPIVRNGRLLLFWPVFAEKAEEAKAPAAGDPPALPNTYLEVKIAWSSYENGKWAAKRTLDSTFSVQSATLKSTILLQVSSLPDGMLNLALVVAGSAMVSDTKSFTSLLIPYGKASVDLSPCGVEPAKDAEVGTLAAQPDVPRVAPNDSAIAFNGFWSDDAKNLKLFVGEFADEVLVPKSDSDDTTQRELVLGKITPGLRVTPSSQHPQFIASEPFVVADRNATYIVTPEDQGLLLLDQLSDPDLVAPTLILPTAEKVKIQPHGSSPPPFAKVTQAVRAGNPWLQAAISRNALVKGV